MSKFLKILAIILACIAAIAAALAISYFVITKDALLDKNKLLSIEQNIVIYDGNGEEIASTYLQNKRQNVKLKDLTRHTINAFIASEDRNFYRHNGLNYKRMFKAAYKNLISHSFKEGASTISQQLVKNTHLTGDKTISRKLKEIRLTKKLEKRYSKDEILEMYLNTIYFGHNCYGLQSAAEFYFDKKAEDLSLEESATLAGLLISPNNYSPFKYPEKSLQRRNVVLKAMKDCEFISQKDYLTSSKKPVGVKQNSVSFNNGDYINAVFDELENADLNFYDISDGCKIYTDMNPELQNFIEKLEYPCDNAVIITSAGGNVLAYKSTIGNVRRQPGSTIKPLAVYAPAIEEKLISPHTQILDEKIDYNGYSPSNSDNRFHGFVPVHECLSKSYNVPAVKILNSLTIAKAEKYLNAMNIALEDADKNLSLALGGMNHGLTVKQIADCYTQFASSGVYSQSCFIKKIEDKNGKIIFKAEPSPSRVFSEGTASLINQTLLETTKSGTAKMLRNLKFDVASKTGTCGSDEGNTDAYSVNYTSEHTICVWLGDKNNKRLQITGGNQCCNIAEQILIRLYGNEKPAKLETEKGTTTVEIDAELYYNSNKTEIADELSPMLNKLKVKTLAGNAPQNTSTRFAHPTIKAPTIKVENNSVNIELCQTKYYSYIVKRSNNTKNEVIYDSKWKKQICDTPPEGAYVYTVCPYYFDGKNRHYGDEITLPQIYVSSENKKPQIKIPEIAKGDWYNK